MSTRKQADLADLQGQLGLNFEVSWVWTSRSAGFELVSSKAQASFTCVLTDTRLVLKTNTILLPIKQHIHWNDFCRCLRGNHYVIYLNSLCSVWKCVGKSYERWTKPTVKADCCRQNDRQWEWGLWWRLRIYCLLSRKSRDLVVTVHSPSKSKHWVSWGQTRA